jgi:hypothetical protein
MHIFQGAPTSPYSATRAPDRERGKRDLALDSRLRGNKRSMRITPLSGAHLPPSSCASFTVVTGCMARLRFRPDTPNGLTGAALMSVFGGKADLLFALQMSAVTHGQSQISKPIIYWCND